MGQRWEVEQQLVHDRFHGMRLVLAPLCLRFGEVQINDIEVVQKSYPNFWQDIEKGGFKITSLIQTNN